ncbi:hypothetical protein RB4348 [Rhodopirellula baltica SH 1]|uniref:Uncharacterized protein n=1 Tax=Rhodopirellula baltica (strain DSM 10527 / NCIMB 13988 / SH1) TaxID=243090 RepID=Q7USR7_RHOBA|nr:hypothetical protein RB4348 [Rhodopirellula baltica SH 1]
MGFEDLVQAITGWTPIPLLAPAKARAECRWRKQKAMSWDMAFVVRFGNRNDLTSRDQLAL